MLGLSWAGFLVLSGFSCQGTFYIRVLPILSCQSADAGMQTES